MMTRNQTCSVPGCDAPAAFKTNKHPTFCDGADLADVAASNSIDLDGPDRCEECTDRPECYCLPTEEDARAALAGAVERIVHWGGPFVNDAQPAPIIGSIEYDLEEK